MEKNNLSHIRRNYQRYKLTEANTVEDPVLQFGLWLKEAIDSKEVHEPTAMVLSTTDKELKVSSRMVLLKHYDQDGFVFFTNYKSRKGRQISQNNWVSLLFYWPEMERQVRIEGVASETSASLSDEYFNKRPLKSRSSAIVSPQSEVISDRDHLENMQKDLIEKKQVERPAYWGGYRVKPEYFEFWQGREDRLHDRIVFNRFAEGWKMNRLAP